MLCSLYSADVWPVHLPCTCWCARMSVGESRVLRWPTNVNIWSSVSASVSSGVSLMTLGALTVAGCMLRIVPVTKMKWRWLPPVTGFSVSLCQASIWLYLLVSSSIYVWCHASLHLSLPVEVHFQRQQIDEPCFLLLFCSCFCFLFFFWEFHMWIV